MRIRKHARLIAAAAAAEEDEAAATNTSIPTCERATLQQTHVCELNRSPWDVISFTATPQSPSSSVDHFYYTLHGYQVEYNHQEDYGTGNGIEEESAVTAFKSISVKEEPPEEEDEDVEEDDREDDDEEEEEEEEEVEEEKEKRFSLLVDVDEDDDGKRIKKKIGLRKTFVCCNKTDGKGWNCRREAKQGHSLCEHHINQLRSYQYSYNHSTKKSDIGTTTTKALSEAPRRRNKSARVSSAAPSDFYYYSGFGPLWGKKRRGGKDQVKRKEREVEDAGDQIQIQTTTTTSSSPLSYVDYDIDHDLDNDDDDDDDDDGVDGRKRIRKPIKARSLKSLL